jgi:hypothetical protein
MAVPANAAWVSYDLDLGAGRLDSLCQGYDRLVGDAVIPI